MNKLSIEAIITAFDASYDGLQILDRNGNTLYINDACTRIEGISREEAYSENIRELVENGVYSESVTLMVLEKKASVTITQTAKNGKQVLVTGTPIFDAKGDVDIVFVNSRDITDLTALRRNLSASVHQLKDLQLEHRKYNGIVAHSNEMQKLLGTALHVANVDSTILITGESGVGKGVLARFIHDNGLRVGGPFIADWKRRRTFNAENQPSKESYRN